MCDIDKELDKLSMLIDSARVLAEKIEDENPLLGVYEICSSRLLHDGLYVGQTYH